ncbi:MAG: hypothetical protein R2568_08295 [Candidatus Scalindua sp.]|jgi:hypothetical protein|nr:hypothetical protein [Candidatus Scalindua sp.]MDV5166732.1 hypothetical protein [Candidatus Scalindua sp.]
MLLNTDALVIESGFSSILSVRPAVSFGRAIHYSLYGPDRQYGKGQNIKDCNLAQIEYAVKMDIKIEWNSDYDD